MAFRRTTRQGRIIGREISRLLSDKLERQRQDCEPLAEKWSLNRLKLSRSDHPVIRLRTTLMRSRLLLPRLAERVLLHDGSGFEAGLTRVCEVTTSITNAATAPKGFASYFLSPHRGPLYPLARHA